jgi:TrmH family RNA methyltransferase
MPMKGRADSLNAAVAGAVLAYEVLAALERG